MDVDEDGEVAAALAVLRDATRESAERRLALCTPRLLAALRHVLLIPRHASARVDAMAALVNLSLEPANKVRIVRAGAVPALVEVLRSGGSTPEAREHAPRRSSAWRSTRRTAPPSACWARCLPC
ncbi:U-box domain-containing protein 39-like [Hordeum vulgare]|nr:U-box domain-containing protein 39-like [Hordeum vulgare]